MKAFKDESTGETQWKRRNLVISNKLNGLSGAVIVGDQVILGSHVDNGILICTYETEGKYTDIESQTGYFAKSCWTLVYDSCFYRPSFPWK